MTIRQSGYVEIFDNTCCELGESPLWHPELKELFWLDIERHMLFRRGPNERSSFVFDHYVTAIGWVDNQKLIAATEKGVALLSLDSGKLELLAPVEMDIADTRSNDGRTDPWGGFWFGTMSKNGSEEVGSIYRYFEGEVRTIFQDVTTPNTICFSPDAHFLYFSDTRRRIVWRQRLDEKFGWPAERAPEVFIDLRHEQLKPDGAACDASGHVWIALWGASKVQSFDTKGLPSVALCLPAPNVTCPAFGGTDLRTLFVTTARSKDSSGATEAGMLFASRITVAGQAEHQATL